MLELAKNYRDRLEAKFNDTWFKDEYKFYHASVYCSNPTIEDNSWEEHQFVSIYEDDYSEKIVGYIGYSIDRQTDTCHELNVINFYNDGSYKTTFAVDLGRVLVDIFEKFHFRKLTFSVVVGNPIESSYDNMIRRYGGRIVGTFKKHIRLIDGQYYDEKYYEILREDYFEHVEKKEN